MEELRHFLGLCGEPHPSLMWLFTGGAFVLYLIKHNITWCWKKGCDFCKAKYNKIVKK